VVSVVGSCGSAGGAVAMLKAPLDGGGGDAHTSDPVTGDPRSASLASDLGARVLVGRPCALTWILAIYLSLDIGGELSTGMTSTGSS
jgi:hypothetical protein